MGLIDSATDLLVEPRLCLEVGWSLIEVIVSGNLIVAACTPG